ncbi:MAG TPA: amino acid adenylation domain-containing protein, partial [Kofleriaceae bacterium]
MTADHLAYIMYTSGSTGRPKGVAIPHRGVVRLALDTSYMSLAPDDVMLQFAPLWFDASTFEIWIPLLRGAAVACARPGELSLAEIAGELRALQVTTCLLMAPLFHQFVAEHLEGLAGLRHLLAGGDTLSPRAVQRMRAALPAVRLIDGYGPTENTTITTCEVVTTVDGTGRIPIGRPIDGTRVYVLDERLAPQPIGAVGEIYAAGAGLARGYLGDPQRTAASFLPDPFGPPGARMYRTGDLGRWLPDGRLDFLGRRDHQVKVRGFRIELGEIETMLLRHPDVREAAVIARDDGDGQGGDARSLCGYVVADRPVTPDALRAHLAATLPPHMVPPWIVVLDALPLTDRGKIDRARLPSPRVAQPAAQGPATATERRLARIWAEVLALDPDEVGVGQSFFEAGGHSLSAMRLAAAIERDLGRQLSLVELFRAPTLRDLARILDDGERRDAVAIPRAPERDVYPVSSIQRRIYATVARLTDSTVYNMVGGVWVDGDLDVDRLAAAFEALVRRHEVLRTSFEIRGGELVQRIHPHVAAPIERRTVTAAGDAPAAVATVVRPFDLARPPLARLAVVEVGPRLRLLVLDVHHIVADGAAISVLVRELLAAYRGDELAPLPVQA